MNTDLGDGFVVHLATRDQDPILGNLFELYLHDMAEWFRFDGLPNGRYSESTDAYWEEGNDIHLLYQEDIPVGFGLVGPNPDWIEGGIDMHEFFVVRRHRRSGVGTRFAEYLWRRYPVPWVVRVYQHNLPALPFWRGAVSAFSDGQYREETLTRDGRPWSHFFFDGGEEP